MRSESSMSSLASAESLIRGKSPIHSHNGSTPNYVSEDIYKSQRSLSIYDVPEESYSQKSINSYIRSISKNSRNQLKTYSPNRKTKEKTYKISTNFSPIPEIRIQKPIKSYANTPSLRESLSSTPINKFSLDSYFTGHKNSVNALCIHDNVL